ncbi:MAG: DUF1284 domain-containing protein [Coriobacteriia bacterium]
MSPRLRGHHLICLQFYRGQGYSDSFVTNLDRVQKSAAETPAVIVSGGDDVCAACPGLGGDGNCHDPNTGEAEALRLDALALQLLDAAIGETLSLSQARARLAADAAACDRWRTESCGSCLWESVCQDGWQALLRG